MNAHLADFVELEGYRHRKGLLFYTVQVKKNFLPYIKFLVENNYIKIKIQEYLKYKELIECDRLSHLQVIQWSRLRLSLI